MLTERRVDDLIAAGQMRSPAEHLMTWNGLQLSEAHSSVKWRRLYRENLRRHGKVRAKGISLEEVTSHGLQSYHSSGYSDDSYWQFRSPGACSKGSLIHGRSVWVGPSNDR